MVSSPFCNTSSTRLRNSCSSSADTSSLSPSAYTWTSGSSGVRKHLRPATLVEDLDPVLQVDVTILEPLGEDAHDEPFLRPGARHLPVHDVRDRELRDELRQLAVDRRQELEELAEARNRVVGGEELREDVAAADGAGEDHSVLGRGLGQLGERGRGADDLEAAAFDEPVDLARHRHRERELADPSVAPDQAEVQQQGLFDGDLPRLVVDQVEALGGPVEDDAQVGSDGSDEAFRLADEPPERRGLPGGRSGVNECAATASTPSGPSTSGSTNDAAE